VKKPPKKAKIALAAITAIVPRLMKALTSFSLIFVLVSWVVPIVEGQARPKSGHEKQDRREKQRSKHLFLLLMPIIGRPFGVSI
jgi:hypothetical protein